MAVIPDGFQQPLWAAAPCQEQLRGLIKRHECYRHTTKAELRPVGWRARHWAQARERIEVDKESRSGWERATSPSDLGERNHNGKHVNSIKTGKQSFLFFSTLHRV